MALNVMGSVLNKSIARQNDCLPRLRLHKREHCSQYVAHMRTLFKNNFWGPESWLIRDFSEPIRCCQSLALESHEGFFPSLEKSFVPGVLSCTSADRTSDRDTAKNPHRMMRAYSAPWFSKVSLILLVHQNFHQGVFSSVAILASLPWVAAILASGLPAEDPLLEPPASDCAAFTSLVSPS